MVFSVFSFPRSFSFIYSSFTLILLISACSRFSFFVPVSRLLPLASVSNPGLLFLRCIYGFPAKDYFCFKNLPAFKLSWLLTDPASAETPLALSFQRFSALKISLRSRPYLFFRSLNLCLSAMRCCPISLPIETILLFLRCSFLEFHPGGSFSCLILNVVFILFNFGIISSYFKILILLIQNHNPVLFRICILSVSGCKIR